MARLCTSMATGDDPWTATSLISAFVELVIAFLFLAGATITYFTSKFIKIFGLHLPCFDRGGAWIERQSDVRRHAFYNRLSKELCGSSRCFLNKTFIESRSACDQSSPSTTGSEHSWVTSLKPMRPKQLYFHCRQHRPQMPCHCFCHPHLDELNTGIFDEATASRSQTQRKHECFPLDGQLLGCKSSCQRRLHKEPGKRKYGSLCLEGLPDADRVSDDDGIEGAEADGTLLEREHSLKVFPEECIDYNALIQGYERNGVMERPRGLGKFGSVHGSSVHAESTQPLELNLRQSPFKPENAEGRSERCAQICGGAAAAEPARDTFVEECEFAFGGEEKIERKPEDVGKNVRDRLSNHNERAESRTKSAGSVITGDGRLKGSARESDDDTHKLKEKLAADREILNRTYLELEKERIASASAADNAMGLITSLQEDKAALQMEAVQYQRIAEERAMYDEEAIVTLRDILLKREAEKLALEKEIELYRRKLLIGGLEAAEKRKEEDEVTDDFVREGGIDESMLEFSKRKKEMLGERSTCAGDTILAQVFGARGESNTEFTNKNSSLLSCSTNLLKPFEFIIDDGSSSEEGMAGHDGDHQFDNLDTFRQVQSSAPTVALASFRNHSEGSADMQWQHALPRIWNLEEQISSLRTKYNKTLKQPFEAMSSQFNAKEDLRLSKEIKETLGCENFKPEYSAAIQTASRKRSGVRNPGRRIMRAKSEADRSPSIPKRCRTCDNSNADRTDSCEMDPTNRGPILDVMEDSLRENKICSEIGDPFSTLDPIFRAPVTLEEAQVQDEKPSETVSPSCFSLEEGTVSADDEREAIDDDANEISKYSSPGVLFSDPCTL